VRLRSTPAVGLIGALHESCPLFMQEELRKPEPLILVPPLKPVNHWPTLHGP
jgi:hypothetical protein